MIKMAKVSWLGRVVEGSGLLCYGAGVAGCQTVFEVALFGGGASNAGAEIEVQSW